MVELFPEIWPANRRRLWFKRFLPRGLYGRVLLILVTPLFLVQMIAAYVFFDNHWDTMTRRLARSVAGEINWIVENLEAAPADLPYLRERAQKHYFLQLSLSPDWHLTESNPPPTAGVLAREMKTVRQAPTRLQAYVDMDYVELETQTTVGILRVLVPTKRLFSASVYVLMLWMVGSSVILLAVAILFMRNQIRPIRRLAVAAEQFGKGQDVTRFKPEGAAEVRQAAIAFLRMRERIKRQITQRTEMLAGVSHDLRTPLTRMKLHLALWGDAPEIEGVKSDVLEMERMIGGYLDFARGEGGEAPEWFDLALLLTEITETAKREGIDAYLKAPACLNIMMRPNALRRCINNLVINAGKYGQHVWLIAELNRNTVIIHIDDDGPGIPANQHEEVFKPFRRLEESRNPLTGGVGLGLAIARDIARAHGGDIILGKSPHGGLRVNLRLPL